MRDVIEFLLGLLGRSTTVSTITAGLGRMVRQLEQHEANMIERSEQLADQYQELLAKQSEALQEARRAKDVALKVRKLIGE